jgi:hypothetical protein
MNVMTKVKSSKAFFLAGVFLLSFSSLAQKSMSENISPWDEMYHLSYIQYVYDGHLPRPGDALNTWAREGFSCKPVYPFGATTDVPCGQIAEPFRYPEGGTNSATGWPPIFYSTVAMMLKIPMLFASHPIAYSRVFTAFLWSVGVALIAYVSLKRNLRKSAVLAVSLIISSLPFAFFHASFITPHAMIPLLLGLGLLADQLREQNNWAFRKSALILFAYALIASLTVPHFSPIVVIIGSIWIIDEIRRGGTNFRNQWRKTLLFVLASFSTFISYKFWGFIQNRRTISWDNSVNASAGQTVIDVPWTQSAIMESIWRFIPHSVDRYQFIGPIESFLSESWGYFLLAGLGALVCGLAGHIRNSAIGLLIVGIGYSLYMQRVAVAPVPPRYGISLVLFGFALIPNVLKSRAVSYAVLTLAAGTYLLCLNLTPFGMT